MLVYRIRPRALTCASVDGSSTAYTEMGLAPETRGRIRGQPPSSSPHTPPAGAILEPSLRTCKSEQVLGGKGQDSVLDPGQRGAGTNGIAVSVGVDAQPPLDLAP